MAPRVHTSFIVLFRLITATSFLLAYFYTDIESYQPLYRLKQHEFPAFVDDMDRTSLVECTLHHLTYLQQQNPDQITAFGDETYTNSWLVHSIKQFLEKLNTNILPGELGQFLSNNYIVYQSGGRKDLGLRDMLVTGYYEPIFEGSLIKQHPYLTPIYCLPSSLITIIGKDGEQQIGRYNRQQQFVAYWNREEIESNPDLLAGNELAFLKDPFDAFLLHVQGSGKIQFPDKSVRSVRFAGSNGLEYKSIGKLLADERVMPLEAITIPSIRNYLQSNPKQQQRILHYNPRYIFFSWGDDSGPRGSSGAVLTPGRSIAIDDKALPRGTLGYLVSRIPQVGKNGQLTSWKPLTRFVFPQDSGAAIKGAGRVDVFGGNGQGAEFASNLMKEKGKLYFFVMKYPLTP